jgi:hypothetical protein
MMGVLRSSALKFVPCRNTDMVEAACQRLVRGAAGGVNNLGLLCSRHSASVTVTTAIPATRPNNCQGLCRGPAG